MVFNSIEFAAFLPIVFILYWFVFSGWDQRNWKGISRLEAPSSADEQGTRAAQRPQKQLQNICLIPALANDRLLIKVILPVGISFYTFSALGYTIDVNSRA